MAYGLIQKTVDEAIARLRMEAAQLPTTLQTFFVGSSDPRLTDARTPTSHATSHQSGGSDAIKLDDLAAPDDNTDLNASTTKHGLLKKLSNAATDFLDGTGAFDTVKDADLSTSDITTNDVSSSKHGFAPKSPADATKFLNGAATSAFALVKDSDLSTSDITTNDATTSKHGFLQKLPGGTTTFLRADGTFATPSGTAKLVQQVNTQTGAVSTGTTQIPADDTIPQNTEGDQYMTLAVTPTSATNILMIDVVVNLSCATNVRTLVAALFQDTTANALAAAATHQVTGVAPNVIAFRHYMVAGTTSATTFKVRAGTSGTGTTSFNGSSGGRLFGGVYASSITIEELVP